nr:cytochrome c oxidase subunit 2 [Rhizosolenia setigera]WAQ69994.1 cytochrome c oxidase subunit 2 [Rhizosolenia setigera]WAQ70030.1 cytochrome c oxidase subunit 2 [Rhizosolenia setigera]WAQ70066.1 cytochrome c oxidase subunit 2 [Rhizosolenia setigera]WAQ70138.1 cytochrome c oxidase subunit 2 [Rhizosolenia setigera]
MLFKNLKLKFIISSFYLNCPVEFQYSFNEPASPIMEGIINFHNHLMVVLSFIGVFVAWLLINCIKYYSEFSISKSTQFTHSKELEIIWTSIPALILLLLATPSFTLLYSMDEIVDPELTLKILGHQWYWGYEMSEYNTCYGDLNLQYNCYMMVFEGLPENKKGYFRLLETNRRVLLPTDTHIRLLVSAADVLHSWTVPSFGVKVDACPGRLNQLNLYLKRTGLFFGQCSEICGVNHGFMPISVLSVNSFQFNSYILNRIEF